MIRKRGFAMMLFSLALAVGAAVAAKNWLEQRSARSTGSDMNVLVAAMELPYGTRLEARHVSTISVPKGTPLGNHFAALEEVEGLVAAQKILAGEVLLKERLAKTSAGSTLAALIKPDMRAVTVRVDDVVGVAGFLLPGNRVDVVAARKTNDRAITETVLYDLAVLAVDQTSSQDKDQPVVVRAVTLEMTPKQAEILVRAREEGRIQLTLRNPADVSQGPVIVAETPPPVAAPAPKIIKVMTPRPATSEITIIRGTRVNAATPST
jgi:pilus assembly protein CpaB